MMTVYTRLFIYFMVLQQKSEKMITMSTQRNQPSVPWQEDLILLSITERDRYEWAPCGNTLIRSDIELMMDISGRPDCCIQSSKSHKSEWESLQKLMDDIMVGKPKESKKH